MIFIQDFGYHWCRQVGGCRAHALAMLFKVEVHGDFERLSMSRTGLDIAPNSLGEPLADTPESLDCSRW